nr:putative ribonuclease H-like domain-containing protein [Tanacetum cinerariifolium]
MWEDFVYQVKHKNSKKINEMYYPRFMKVIIHHFMSKDPSIPRRNKFGALLPIELTNEDIRNSNAYKEYYAIAIGAAPPKPKASLRRTRSSSDTTITPLTVAASPRLTTFAKGKQTAKASKAKSLSALSERVRVLFRWGEGTQDGLVGKMGKRREKRLRFVRLVRAGGDQMVEQRCAEMDTRLDAMSIDFDEELYPHMLTAIAGRRWVIRHGLRLATMKCAESLEMRQAFADVVSAGIAKGMSEGLKHGVEHGHAQRTIESFEAYDPEAEAKFATALQSLKDLKLPLLDQLEGLKDAPMDVIMASFSPSRYTQRCAWACTKEIKLADAIAANISRAEQKKRSRIICRTYGVGSHRMWCFEQIVYCITECIALWTRSPRPLGLQPVYAADHAPRVGQRCPKSFLRKVSHDYSCEMKGIMRQYSVARIPQQNRVAKRRDRTLIEAARTMLADSKLPTTFWAKAASSTCYVLNRVLVVKTHNKTPYELFHGRTPMLSFMRPFGYPVTILNTIDHVRNFNGKADEEFFVGYLLNRKAFRVFNSRTRIVEETLHIRFSENTPNNVGTRDNNNAGQASKEKEPGKDYILLPLWTTDPPFLQEPKNSQDARFKPSNDIGKKVNEVPRQEKECKDQEEKESVNNTNRVNAVSSTVNASSTEVNAVGRKSSIKLPDDLNLPELEDISIFADSNENVFGAEADLNNLESTFQVSPIPTTRIHKDHPLEQVIKDLYLAPQTRRMSKNLEEHGLVSVVNQRTNHKDLQNCLLACFLSQMEPQKELCTSFEKLMHDKFQMSSMGELTLFLGLQVKQKEDGIFISQDKYVAVILKKYGSTEFKTASTPMETQKPLLKVEDGKEVDVHIYRSMIGSLMYLTSLRPDIMFAVCTYARYQVNPKVSHLHAVKRIFKYLKGQLKLGLWYSKDSPFDLMAYTDSDYAGASLDRESTTGSCQFLRCRLISWQCKKQTVVANFITKVEYVATSSCYSQVLWIQNQLLDYGYNFLHTKIFIDNNSMICIIKNLIFHSKTKHIEIRHHFIRDSNDKKLIQMVKVHTDKNVADLLTKAFDVSRF